MAYIHRMLKHPRHILFILLALIQFVAPLVHAHTHSSSLASYGLHIPGLENYRTDDSAAFLPATSQLADSEGLVVGVDAGIRQNISPSHADAQAFVILPTLVTTTSAQLLAFDVNFSPQLPSFYPQILLNTQAPRAPPF